MHGLSQDLVCGAVGSTTVLQGLVLRQIIAPLNVVELFLDGKCFCIYFLDAQWLTLTLHA